MQKIYLLLVISLIGISSCRTVKRQPIPVVNDHCSVTVDSVRYWLSTCSISDTMIKGTGDKGFSTSVISAKDKPDCVFNVHAYGVGFPTYGIMGYESGAGFRKETPMGFVFKDDVLQKGVYNGYIEIGVFGEGGRKDWLHFKIHLVVL